MRRPEGRVAGSQPVGDNIDNIVVSPRGGILLCEDGDPGADAYPMGTRLVGLTPNDYRAEEWAGACFDPDGEVLFVNIQVPGITIAI